MFKTALNTIMVEGLRALYAGAHFQEIFAVAPSVGIEYPEGEFEWPALFLQFRPTVVELTGINPDQYQSVFTGTDFDWNNVRRGYFEGAVDISILSLSSGERDVIWDGLAQLILMGRKSSSYSTFWDSVDANDLINVSFQEGEVVPIGDSVGVGVPWNPEVLSYEATIRIACMGEFFADIVDEQLLSLSGINVSEYTDADSYPPDDGQGGWNGFG